MGGVHALTGRVVRLEPLGPVHAAGLAAAAAEDRAHYQWTRVPDGAEGVAAYLADAAAERDAGRRLPFATILVDGERVVGSTSFFPEHWTWPAGRPGVPDTVEIGATWLAASAQRTAANTEAKLLMLTHAFEAWGVQRVQLKTDARNERSRAAIARLGAQFEGVLRHHMPAYGPAGGLRDSAYYSIIPAEWPAIKERLTARLAAG
jgi:RimJ/RimL family protein N-acetyltransferase